MSDKKFEDAEELKAWLIGKGVVAEDEEETASQQLFDKKYNRPSKLVGISSDALLRAGLSDPLAQHISNKLKEQQQQDGEMSCCSRILVFNVLFEYGNTTLLEARFRSCSMSSECWTYLLLFLCTDVNRSR